MSKAEKRYDSWWTILRRRLPSLNSSTLSPSIVLASALSQFREILEEREPGAMSRLQIPKNGRWIGRLQN